MTSPRQLRFIAAVIGFLGASTCGGSPPAPSPVPTLSVTCPGAATVQSTDGNPMNVAFDAPQTSGGTSPISTSCTPQSGSSFPVGSSTVTCNAQDSRSQQASCSFVVTVQRPPRLTSTRFLAFGDSITEGTLSASVTLLIVSPPHSYPFLLQDRLVTRYRQQTPVVLNEGIGGEKASEGGIRRFRSVLLQNRPEVVLLMQGSNDLLDLEPGANAAISALRSMVQEAKSQGVKVALATIAPQRAGGARRRDNVVAIIPGFNDRIRALANAEGVALIDVYNGMKDDVQSTIGVDDLHPTIHGYEVMTGIFFDAIKNLYEERQAASAGNRSETRTLRR